MSIHISSTPAPPDRNAPRKRRRPVRAFRRMIGMGTRREPSKNRSSMLSWDKVVAAGWLVGLGVLAVMKLLPFMVPLWYALLSLVAFAAYAADKAQAATRRQRISEQALHVVS